MRNAPQLEKQSSRISHLYLTVTPLDVVRVRLQSQQHTPSSARPQSVSSPNRLSPFVNIPPNLGVTACCREVFWVTNTADCCVAAPRVSAAGAAARTATECAVQETQRRTFDSTLDGLRKIARNEGLTTLWRGLSPTLVMAVPANVIYFTGYDWLRTNPHSLIRREVSDTYAPLVAGSLARVLAAIFVSPIEMFRTRMQAAHTPNSTSAAALSSSTSASSSSLKSTSRAGSHYRETFAGIRELVTAQGYTALWRGLGLTLWRDVPFSAVYWWGYEAGRRALDDLRTPSPTSTSTRVSTTDDHSATLVDSFVAGAGSGAVAALLTTPFDVGKTRQQVVRDSNPTSSSPSLNSSTRQPNISTSSSLSASSNSSSSFSSSSSSSTSTYRHHHRPEELPMPRFLWHIFQEQGLQGLFRGWAARCLKVAPACAIMISSYELGKKMAVDINANV